MNDKQFEVRWIDLEREPQQAPNPNFPEGRDIDMSKGELACTVKLPYPAQRCGIYFVACRKCKLVTGVTTAGRPDDPRQVKMACKAFKHFTEE